MGRAVFESRRQRTAHGVARAVGQFRLHDPRGTGADKYADSAPAPAGDRGIHSIDEAILPQGKLGQAIIAAIEYPQLRGQSLRIDAGNLADMRVDRDGFEVAVGQAAALLEQAQQRWRHTRADAAGRRELREQQGLPGFHGNAERSVMDFSPEAVSVSSRRGNTSRITA